MEIEELEKDWGNFFFSKMRIPKVYVDRLPFPAKKELGELVHLFPDLDQKRHLQEFSIILRATILKDRWIQRVAEDTLRDAGILGPILEMVKKNNTSAFLPDLFDLSLLYATTTKRRPARILELGSGVSTLVLALALQHNGTGTMLSLDPDPHWADNTRKSLPLSVAQVAEVLHAPAMHCNIGKSKSIAFDCSRLDEAPPDLIYIDGSHEGARFLGAENVALLESRLEPGTVIIIDARLQAIRFFLDNAFSKRRYAVFSQGLSIGRSGFSLGLDQYANTIAILLR